MADQEFELKRIEAAFKSIDAVLERQFKLATFGLAGNIGAIGAASIAIKDYRDKDRPLPSTFSDAIFWFLIGAIVSALSLGASVLSSEIVVSLISKVFLNGPKKADIDKDILRVGSGSSGVLIFMSMYAFAAFCFFFGLYKVVSLIK